MAYNEKLALRVENILSEYPNLTQKKMFGGLCFMLQGHMCCGIVEQKLMVRIGPEAYDSALEEPETAVMDFTGKPMRGMIYVLPPALNRDNVLEKWVIKGVEFVQSLPPCSRK